jgi:hypothetical protein
MNNPIKRAKLRKKKKKKKKKTPSQKVFEKGGYIAKVGPFYLGG